MKKFIISLFAVLMVSAAVWSGEVTGSGKTQQEAFKDARAKLPAGKHAIEEKSTKNGNRHYVTLRYRDATPLQVTGSGDTYQKAFKDAQARLPAGKYHNSVTSKKQNGTFYVTLHYRD